MDSEFCAIPPSPELAARLRADQGMQLAIRERLSLPRRERARGFSDGVIRPDGPNRVMAAAKPNVITTHPVLVVLVDFPGSAIGNSISHYQDLFFSTGRKIPTGSVREYYDEVSRGKATISGTVIGPYTLSHPCAWYANNASGLGSAAPNAQDMVKEVLTLIGPAFNFGPYDANLDGYVDALVVIHAGQGGEVTGSPSDIWSHKWVLRSPHAGLGASVYGYLTVPEDCKTGVCAHELGHLLFGLPDLYDTTYASEGVGNWCLMGGGSWNGHGNTPAHPSAWCKAQLGWAPVGKVAAPGHQDIDDIEVAGGGILRLDGGAPTEYFLLEHRRQLGFDQQLPGAGLLIWHCDDAMPNNDVSSHYKVGLVQADNKRDLETGANRGDPGDPYPGTTGNNEFSSSSRPAVVLYSGGPATIGVRNIKQAGPKIATDLTP